MLKTTIIFADRSIQVSYPQSAEKLLGSLLCYFVKSENEKVAQNGVHVSRRPSEDGYSIHSTSRDCRITVTKQDVADRLLTFITEEFVYLIKDGLIFHSGALSFQQKTVILPAPSGSGKSILTAWLISRGYSYLTDELVFLPSGDEPPQYLSRPLNIRAMDQQWVADLLGNRTEKHITGKNVTLMPVRPEHCGRKGAEGPLSLILLPKYSAGRPLSLEVLSPAKAAMQLIRSLINARNLKGHGFGEVTALARTVPALRLRYGAIEQLADLTDHLLPFLLESNFSPHGLKTFFTPFQHAAPKSPDHSLARATSHRPETRPIPAATPMGDKKRLTIGMATYDDYDGVYFTVQAIRMYHPEVTELTEILVVDNHPGGPCGQQLKNLENSVVGYRYLPLPEHSGTAVRDYIFRHAAGEYVLSIDCHVLIIPGAIKQLIDYFEKERSCRDLLQGPLLLDDFSELKACFEPTWRAGMFGIWAKDDRARDINGPPFDIPMQGLGLFACKKDAWPGFNPRFRGFGGEESYLHEKFRQNGHRTLCLPFLRWLHRFDRPMGVPYPVQWIDRIFNYMVGFQELGLDTEPIRKHFAEHLGKESADRIFSEIESELQSPFFYFDALYCITLDPEGDRFLKMRTRFKKLGIDKRVRVFRAIATPDNHHIGCALSHRTVIAHAHSQKLSNVMVFEDDANFLDNSLLHLTRSVAELKQRDWNVFFLGGRGWDNQFQAAENCRFLTNPIELTCTHGVAYSYSTFEKILSDIPNSEDKISTWIKEYRSIDQYLMKLDKRYLAQPVVSSQVEFLDQENE